MKRIINRIKGFDLKRMFKMIGVISSRSDMSSIHIFLDIFRCFIKFGSGYMDYYLFYFETLSDDIKDTYINISVNKGYIRHCNDPKYYYVLDDKPTFLNKYKEFIKRDFIDIRNCSYDEYEEFFNKHKQFMSKPIDGLCGYGIELINTDNVNSKTLFNELKNKKQFLLEERIKQNDEVNKIYSDSINTLRIVTLNKNNNVEVLFSAMRIGNNGKVVDNFNNGGLMAVVDDDGVIRKPILDKDNKVYTNHPLTNTSIVGFKIPYFDKVIETCKQLALVTPELGLCGWDIAITNDGVDVVEGNQIPGYDIYQSREQLAPSNKGLKEKFDKAIYPEKIGKKVFGKGFCFIKFVWIFLIGALLGVVVDLLNIDFPISLIFITTYLICYKHIDIRPFKYTVIRILLFLLICLIIKESIECLSIVNSSFIECIKYIFYNQRFELLLYIAFFLIICIIDLYFIYPIIDKIIEKLNKISGIILATIFGIIDLYIIFVYIFLFVSIIVYL